MCGKLDSQKCPVHNHSLLSSGWNGNLGVPVGSCSSSKACVRNAGELFQLMDYLRTLPFITLFWLELYPVVTILIAVMPWLIMIFDVGLTDRGPWHGFPKIQMLFVQWGCPILWAVPPLLSWDLSGWRGIEKRATELRAAGLGQHWNQNGPKEGMHRDSGLVGVWSGLTPGSVKQGSKPARKDST